MLGILQSNELWATHYAYLNDGKEAKAARDPLASSMTEAVKSTIKPYCDRGSIKIAPQFTFDQACEGAAGIIVDALYEAMIRSASHFLFCFCSHKDNDASRNGLLSQWRGYGRGGGYAIEFDTERLEAMMEEDGRRYSKSGYFFGDVVYGEKSRDFRFLSAHLKQIDPLAQTILHQFGIADGPRVDETFTPFLTLIARLKDAGFREEGEVRFVYSRANPPEEPEGKPPYKPVCVRPHRGGLVPYVRLLDGQDTLLPIKRVIVGPHPKSALRRRALEIWFAQVGRTIEVTISAIPYLPE